MIELKVVKSRVAAWLLGDEFWRMVCDSIDRDHLVEQMQRIADGSDKAAIELRAIARSALDTIQDRPFRR